MIEKMPPELESRLPEILQFWLDRGRSTGSCDRHKMEEAVKKIYRSGGYDEPELFVWTDSPLAAQLSVAIVRKLVETGDNLIDNIRDSPWNNLWSNLGSNLGDKLWFNLRSNLTDNLWDKLGSNLGDKLWFNLRSNLKDNLWDNLWGNLCVKLGDNLCVKLGDNLMDNLRSNLTDNLRSNLRFNLRFNLRDNLWGKLGDNLTDNLRSNLTDNLRSNLRSKLELNYEYSCYGSMEYWVGWYDTMWKCGVDLPQNLQEFLEASSDLSETGLWIPFKNIVFMSERPTEIHLDQQGRLHNPEGPALLYADGYALFSFHGVTIPKEIVEHPEAITVEAIMEEENAEVRRIMCEIMGWDRYVTESGLQLIDECDDPANAPHTLRLFDTPQQVFNVPVRLLLMTNATPKPTGIVPRYGITVPVEINSALEAAAWMADVSAEQYRELQRAT